MMAAAGVRNRVQSELLEKLIEMRIRGLREQREKRAFATGLINEQYMSA